MLERFHYCSLAVRESLPVLGADGADVVCITKSGGAQLTFSGQAHTARLLDTMDTFFFSLAVRRCSAGVFSSGAAPARACL